MTCNTRRVKCKNIDKENIAKKNIDKENKRNSFMNLSSLHVSSFTDRVELQ